MKLRVLIFMFVMFGFVITGANAVPRIHKPKVTQQVTQKVDINQADATTLASLKGIGPKKAQAIVEYRVKNGPFKSIDALTNVKGINKKFIAKIQKNNPDMVTVGNG